MTGSQYKCPACGGPISFTPESGKMTCGFCASEFEVAEVERFNATLQRRPAGTAPAGARPQMGPGPHPQAPPHGPPQGAPHGPPQGPPPRGFAPPPPPPGGPRPAPHAGGPRPGPYPGGPGMAQPIPGFPAPMPGGPIAPGQPPAPIAAGGPGGGAGDVGTQVREAPPPPRQQPQRDFAWDVTIPEELTEQEAREKGLKHFECPSCGGGIIGTPDTVSTKCPYCDNNFVAETQLRDTLVPTRLIPFRTTREQAIEAFKTQAKKLPLVPGAFTDDAKLAEISGIYVPYWLYGCDVHADAQFGATRVHTSRSGSTETTTTMHYALQRSGSMGFNSIPVAATKIIDDTRTEAIEPFDLRGAKPFGTAYLTGFRANTCTVTADAAHPRAWQRIESSAVGALRGTVHGYTAVTNQGSNIRLLRGGSELVYLPVWMLNIAYGGKTFNYAMNGQSGRLVGEFPVSAGKKWAVFAGIGLAVFLLIFLIVWLVFLR